MYMLDPLELMERRIERLCSEYIDEFTCMQCKKQVDYELICMTPDGPALCEDCAGIRP